MASAISVSVRPHAGQEKVERRSESEYVVWVRWPARDGRANEAAIALLAEHFAVPKSSIRIVRGGKARNKIVQIPQAVLGTHPERPWR